MIPTQAELNQQTDALRKELSFLDQFGVDPADVNIRSKVYQREFTENGVRIPVFVKVYSHKKHPLQRLWRTAISRTETRNLLFFQSIGIAVPRVIAWGQRTNSIGRVTEAFIITEAIPGTQTLSEFIPEACPDRSTPAYCQRRDSILGQLGRWTRAMHAHNFHHQDLKWRNILARMQDDQVELFWIDCPKGDFPKLPFQQKRNKLKDCATLDKLARLHCSREERLRFVATYLQQAADTPAVRELSAAISNYRRQRFATEDERQAIQRKAKANAKAAKSK
jgi:tRNA A-37 threonylcarbamoyl transferase component Bud32